MVAALLAVSIATLMFVSTMMYNQIYAIVTGIGTIDRMRECSASFSGCAT